MNLGANISYLRKQKQLTQEQLAEKMNVSRQTVSRWEADEATPELAKLVELCSFFSCELDALVREDLSAQSEIYSDIRIKRVAPFQMAGYVMISPNPEDDVNGYMERWAAESGLKEAYPDAKRIGWDFPFVSQEQQNRFGMRGYAAAYVLPEHFSTEYSGVRYSENAEADYAVITITDPFVNAFERIPNAYKILMEYLRENGMKEKHQTGCISCFEHVYSKEKVTCMDVYLQVEGAATIDAYLDLKQE